jgi:hypothetical protein
MRQFHHDYLIASGLNYTYSEPDQNSPGIHCYRSERMSLHIHDCKDNWMMLMMHRNGYDMHVNTIGNTRCFDNILDYAMLLHAIGAVNIKSNLRKAYALDGEPEEFEF